MSKPLVLNLPHTPAQCEVMNVSWTGGTPDFTLDVDSSPTTFEAWSEIKTRTFEWVADVCAGREVNMTISDSGGQEYVVTFTANPSTNAMCLGTRRCDVESTPVAPAAENTSSTGLSSTLIAGISFSILSALTLLIIICFCTCGRRRRRGGHDRERGRSARTQGRPPSYASSSSHSPSTSYGSSSPRSSLSSNDYDNSCRIEAADEAVRRARQSIPIAQFLPAPLGLPQSRLTHDANETSPGRTTPNLQPVIRNVPSGASDPRSSILGGEEPPPPYSET